MDSLNILLQWGVDAVLPLALAVFGVAFRAWVQTQKVSKALEAVEAALKRAAAIGSESLVAGTAATPAEAAAGMVEYVLKAKPDALAVLKPAAGALERMALGVLLQRVQDRQDVRDGVALAAAAGAVPAGLPAGAY